MSKIRRKTVPLLVLVILAVMLAPTLWRRSHRHTLLVCIGGCDFSQFEMMQNALARQGIPLSNDGIVDVGMTSLMIPLEFKSRALSALRRLQTEHPNYNVDLIDEADVAYHYLQYQSEVKSALLAHGIQVLPEFIGRSGLVFVKVRWKDKDRAISVLEDVKVAHPEYGLEIPSYKPPSLKLMGRPNSPTAEDSMAHLATARM